MEHDQQITTAAAYLPDELIIDILARLPAKSLCRFKCVSRRWRRLISDPAHRAQLAQTLSGFFFNPEDPAWRFTGLPSSVTPLDGDGGPPLVDAALTFLPPSCGEIEILDSCNGLLLLRCSNGIPCSPRPPPFYVVCNPATREWVALPQPRHTPGQNKYFNTWYAAIGFDPAISSHFYVFQTVEEDEMIYSYVKAVEIYSSETGTWVLWKNEDEWFDFSGRMTYFNGSLHLPAVIEKVASVDNKGQSMRVTQMQHGEDRGRYLSRGYVGYSQGKLLFMNNGYKNDVLSIYVLEDQDSGKWDLKHRVSKPDLFEPLKNVLRVRPTYYIAGFHPHADLIFFYDRIQEKLISYDMNRGDWHVVCALSDFKHAHHPFFPYVPWYSRGLASPTTN